MIVHAGNQPTAEELVDQFILVLMVQNKMVFYVTLIVEKVTQEQVQFAGKIAHQISVMMEHIVVSHHLMEEEQAKLKNVITVKSMVVYGIQFVVMDTIMLAAVFVLLIVNMV